MSRSRLLLVLAICLAGCAKKADAPPAPQPAPAPVTNADPATQADPAPAKPDPAPTKPAVAPAKTDPAAMAPSPDADITIEEVTYTSGDTTLKGAIAYDAKRQGKLPGVLVVHEWWGHNTYVRDRAKMLAELGYLAFAVDMYGDGKRAETAKDAMAYMKEATSDMKALAARFTAAYDRLKAHARFDDGNAKIAAIGYCFGGGVVLGAARLGVPLAGVATFHGTLSTETPAQPGKVHTQILVAHGEADPFVPSEQVAAFKKEMADAGVPLEFHGYPGVKHGFTNPEATGFGKKFDLPLAYDLAADTDSWNELKRFLARVMAPK